MDGDNHAADIAAVTRNCLGTVDNIFIFVDRIVFYRTVLLPQTGLRVSCSHADQG